MSAALIARFGRQITVERSAPGTYVKGHFVAGSTSQQTITASVQPFTSRDMLLLPEGDRTKEYKKIYSIFKFQAQSPEDSSLAHQDVLIIDSQRWSVDKVEDFTDPMCMGITYYKAICSRENQNTNDVPAT